VYKKEFIYLSIYNLSNNTRSLPANAALLDDREYAGRGVAEAHMRSPAIFSCGRGLYSAFLKQAYKYKNLIFV
jgi:hypothetical protein